MATDYQALLLEQTGGVLRITMNRPGALNALNPQMVRDLVGVLTARIRAIEATPASGW